MSEEGHFSPLVEGVKHLSNHGKTKSARIQKRNVFSTDKNEM